MSAELPPSLPVYQAPKERPTAVLPQGLEVTKMPGVMNKMISRMLPKKLGKMLKSPKLMAKTATTKTRNKHKVKFK